MAFDYWQRGQRFNSTCCQLCLQQNALLIVLCLSHRHNCRQRERETMRLDIADCFRTSSPFLRLVSASQFWFLPFQSTAVYQARQKLESISKAKQTPVNSEDLIRYAHRISASNAVCAPLNWEQGDPRRPYPTGAVIKSDHPSGLPTKLKSISL